MFNLYWNARIGTMEIILKSLASAVITAIILVIAQFSGAKLAGALGGIPIVFAVSFVLVTMQSKNITEIDGFLKGGIIGALAGVLFCLILLFLNHKNIELYWFNFAISYAICFAFAFFLSK